MGGTLRAAAAGDETPAAQGALLKELGMASEMVP